jgi:uncharacterized protein
MAALVDVNVLIAVLHARHRHSEAAVRWANAQESEASILVCRLAQMGALRLLTQSALMKEDVLTAASFWKGWDRLMEDSRFSFAEEPEDFEATWREVTRQIPRGRCVETDAYFASLARAGGWRLATFDRGLARFKGVELEVLS